MECKLADPQRLQNLARARALEFGHERAPSSVPGVTGQEGQAATDGDDIVATIAENSGSSDDKGFRPRGLWALPRVMAQKHTECLSL